MVDFIKLTRMNAMGKEVGPVFVNREMIVALSPSVNASPKMTDISTAGVAMLLVKETPEEIMQSFVVQLNASKS